MRRLAALLLLIPLVARGQGIRVSGVTSVQLIELRPFTTDTVPASTIPGTGEVRTRPGGVLATCPASGSTCFFMGAGDRVSVTPVLQDLTVAGWGWVEGLSFHANARARTQLGDRTAFTFPLSNDHFDVVDAYAELERGRLRGRLGRQWVAGGLGAYSFDGADVLARRDALSVEGWGGRALLAGLNETYTSPELAAAENLPPWQDGYIVGARVRLRPDPLAAATFTYQRVILSDRSGLYSERFALDATARRWSANAQLSLAYDLAAGKWNEARLRVGTSTMAAWGGSFEARHSRPYFDLWTIWGAFAPVAYNEARATANWRPGHGNVTLSGHGAFRRYDETDAGFELRTNGWRAGGDASWTPSDELLASASYDVDIGSGAANTDSRVGVRWTRSDGTSLGADASVTQNIYEFKVGTGRIYGAMLSGMFPLRADSRVVVDAGLYQHVRTNGAPGPDWTQRRGSARFEWTLGHDPGMGQGARP